MVTVTKRINSIKVLRKNCIANVVLVIMCVYIYIYVLHQSKLNDLLAIIKKGVCISCMLYFKR